MRYAVLLVLCLLSACRSTDLAPDEFRLDYGRSWADSNFDHRNVDFATDTDSVAVGFTWYLGETASERESQRLADQLTRMTNLLADAHARDREREEPEGTTVIVHPPAPEPAPKPDDAKPTPPPEPSPAPEPKGDAKEPTGVRLLGIEGDALEILIYGVGALLLALVAVIKRKFLIDGVVTVTGSVRDRVRGKKKPGK